MEKIYLSRRNLLTLLSKLDRKAEGDDTHCTIVKYRNESDPYKHTVQAFTVTAVPDEEYYNRDAGAMHPLDDPDNK